MVTDQSDFIITGNVDVIASSEEGELELWDYKSQKPKDLTEDTYDGRDARMQMRIYAHIYRQRTGIMPRRGVIYSLGSIDPNKTPDNKRPENAIIEVIDLENETEYQNAINEFSETVQQIEYAREVNNWPPPENDPGASTCDACPKRYDCPNLPRFNRSYPRHYP